MKLNSEVTIDASLEEVWGAFEDVRNLARWQQNFVSYAQKSGAPGQPGSVAELTYDEKGKTVVAVTHELSFAEAADRNVHLVDGRIVNGGGVPS